MSHKFKKIKTLHQAGLLPLLTRRHIFVRAHSPEGSGGTRPALNLLFKFLPGLCYKLELLQDSIH